MRYTLEKDGQVLVSVDIFYQRGARFPGVTLRTPLQSSFRRAGRPWSRRFELADGQLLATVFHPHRIALRAQLAVEITASQPVLPMVFAAYVIKEILY